MNYKFLLPLLLLFACGSPEEEKKTDPILAQINHSITGEGKYTLLFIHGWGIDQSYWTEQVKHFSKSYRVLTVDLAGHGKSTATHEKWTPSDFASDISKLLNALDYHNVIIVGHSMSGNIGLRIAAEVPDRVAGLIGIDNFQEEGKPMTAEKRKGMEEFTSMLETKFDSLLPMATASLFSKQTDSAIISRVTSSIKSSNRKMVIGAIIPMVDDESDQVARLEKLHVPFGLVNSDLYPTDENWLKTHSKKGFHIRYIKGTGHYPMNENTTMFNQQLGELIAEMGLK